LKGKVNSESDFKEIFIQIARNKGEGSIVVFLEGLSLAPYFEPGSAIPVRIMRRDAEYNVGDLVVFQKAPGIYVAHVIFGKYTDTKGTIKYQTRGLNHETNPNFDKGELTGDQILGIADFSEEFLTGILTLENQGLLFHMKAHALENQFDENQFNIGKEIEAKLSQEIDRGITEVSKLASNIFPDIESIFVLFDNTYGRNRNPREFLNDLINLIGGIYDIDNIKGLSNNNLKLLKQDLLDRCFSIFFEKGLTINTLETLGAPDYIIDLAESYKMHLNYYNIYELQFEEKAETIDYDNYPDLFKKNTEARNLQRTLLWQLSGGRDFLTGEKFTDIFKRQNPEFVYLTDKQLIRAAKGLTTRHHYKTGGIYNKYDCRLSQLVLLMGYIEDQIHYEIRLNSKKGLEYELLFKRAIDSLLKGEPPQHWDLKYQEEFLNENPNGINTFGLKYFFY
jgi:hypothetical protein